MYSLFSGPNIYQFDKNWVYDLAVHPSHSSSPFSASDIVGNLEVCITVKGLAGGAGECAVEEGRCLLDHHNVPIIALYSLSYCRYPSSCKLMLKVSLSCRWEVCFNAIKKVESEYLVSTTATCFSNHVSAKLSESTESSWLVNITASYIFVTVADPGELPKSVSDGREWKPSASASSSFCTAD